MVSCLENLQVEQTNALCNDIEGHKIISKCLFCNIFVGVFAFAHNIGRQFGGKHTIYTRNIMGRKRERDCGLWVLNEIIKKTYPENLNKIVGAV